METFYDKLSASYDKLSIKMVEWLDVIILNIPNLIIALLIAVISFFVSKYIKKFVSKAIKRVTSNRTLVNLAGNLAAVFFGLIVLFIILTIFNLSGAVNKILATAGVVGLAVGLALQDPVNNLFSGVAMAVRSLYAIGDLVETNGYFGTITDINLRSTKLRLPNGQDVVIPNKDVIQNPLTNFTSSGERRIDIEVGVSYGDDLQFVEQVVRKTLDSLAGTLDHKPKDMVFSTFGDSSINLTARYWIAATCHKDYLVEKSKGIKALKKAFDDADIMIPYPIRTLDFGIRGGEKLNEQLDEISIVSKKTRSSEFSIN